MEKEELVKKVKQGKLGYANGVWFIMKHLTSVNRIKHYDPEQMCDVYEEQVVTNWVQDVNVPADIVNEEWFQIEAVQREPANIKHFDHLASDAVWKKLLDIGGENLQYLKHQTPEMQAYAKELNAENIGYFDSFKEEDVKELLMQDGIFIKARNGGWSVYKKNHTGYAEKELCWLRLEDCTDADFFYNKAMECDPNAARAIVELAKKGEAKPYQFIIRHPNEDFFFRYLLDLAYGNQRDSSAQDALKHLKNLKILNYVVHLIECGRNELVGIVFASGNLECNARLALRGYKTAVQIVLKSGDMECVMGLALKGVSEAIRFVLKSGDLEYITRLALNDNFNAIKFVFKSGNLKYVAQLAMRGNSHAINIMLDSEDYETIVNLAKSGELRAVQKVLQSGNLEYITQLAESGNLDAVQVVLLSNRLEYISRLALKGGSKTVKK